MKPHTPITPERLMKLTAHMPMKQINLKTDLNCCKFSELNDAWPQYIIDAAYKCDITGRFAYDAPYLQRYYAGQFSDDVDLWIHRFLSEDGERHVHSHPFNFTTVMLHGGYEEVVLTKDGQSEWRKTTAGVGSDLDALLESYIHRLRCLIRTNTPSQHFLNSTAKCRKIGLYEWHRIDKVYADTWTAVLVPRPRLAVWCFKDGENIETRKASSPDWWKDYNVRPESGVVVGDNRK